jgi:hypothetical protein
MLVKTWATLVERLADSRHPVMVTARNGMDAVQDLALRPLRRTGSATAR